MITNYFQFTGVQGLCDFLSVPTHQSDWDLQYCHEKKTWIKAEKECIKNNMTLSKITSRNDSTLMRRFLQNTMESRINVWTGLKLYPNYTTAEQYGIWSDGSTFYFKDDMIDQENERC